MLTISSFFQLLEVLIAEDERVLADVQGLQQVAPFIDEKTRDVFERRRTLRYDVIHERLDNYKRVSNISCPQLLEIFNFKQIPYFSLTIYT